jgi:hypothetical protein
MRLDSNVVNISYIHNDMLFDGFAELGEVHQLFGKLPFYH